MVSVGIKVALRLLKRHGLTAASAITASDASYNPETGWFRCDTVKFFNPIDMISEIKSLLH